ncbi:MAG TPA: hypothetical protein VJQ61_08620 [Sinomonas sp.]|nr:hypothetical protein [Sinomonas sp.]
MTEMGAATRRRIMQRLHPALTDVLNRLDGTSVGPEFKERAVDVSLSKYLAAPIDYGTSLAAFRWILERADGDGLPLTASGYLKPADVKTLGALLPTMHDWPFTISSEVRANPVLYFRDYLKAVGLVRKYKSSLRLARAGRDGLADNAALWRHLADTLVPNGSELEAEAGIVILVHAATTEGKIDMEAVAGTLSELGWVLGTGDRITSYEVYPVWNRLWAALGNVGDPDSGHYFTRMLSAPARVLVHDALFEEIGDNPVQ